MNKKAEIPSVIDRYSKMNRDYCIFIMTYGRPSNVITLKTLSKIVLDMSNVFLVCSTDDKKLNEYKKLYG